MTKKRFRKPGTPKMLRYFFYEDKLYRTLNIDRPRNILTAWSYDEEKKVQFVYSHIRVHRERAWKTSEVAKMMNRTTQTVWNLMHEGWIEKPPMAWSYKEDGSRYPAQRMWSAKHIYALHDLYIQEEPEPGKRGRLSYNTPSRMELVAKMEEGVSYILEDEDGRSVRAFRETMW